MRSIAAAFFLLLLATLAQAQQSWPAKPMRIIVSTGPGLATDIVARTIADRMSRNVGQQVLVENIAGAGGILGAQATVRAAPDGYTWLFTGGGVLVTNAFLFKALPYDAVKDLAPVAVVTRGGGFLLSVSSELPVKTLAELIAYEKQKPGSLSYAVDSSNIYTSVLGRLLNRTAGMKMAEIPYKSTPQAIQDTIAGRTQVILSAVAPMDVAVKAGKARRLAISSPGRHPAYPELPAISETLPGFFLDGFGLSFNAPAATPPDLVLRMNGAVLAVMKDEAFEKQINAGGQMLARPMTPLEIAEELRAERARWAKIAQDLDIKPQ